MVLKMPNISSRPTKCYWDVVCKRLSIHPFCWISIIHKIVCFFLVDVVSLEVVYLRLRQHRYFHRQLCYCAYALCPCFVLMPSNDKCLIAEPMCLSVNSSF